tara:strand:+ start:1195 stop:1605 length:411 start_codon:yes stop_codon:yes gene_type:complete
MDTLNKKNRLLSLSILILVSNFIFASCGSCQVQAKPPISKKSNSLVTVIPKSGNIEGFVIASCGMCNFGYKKSKGCSLTIKIGDTVYPVEGTSIHKHGDPHSEEGMCSAIRVAYISGKVNKNKFHSDSFTLIESPR